MLRAFETLKFRLSLLGLNSSITSTYEGPFEGIATPTTGGPLFCVRRVALRGSPGIKEMRCRVYKPQVMPTLT